MSTIKDCPENEVYDVRKRFEWNSIPGNFLQVGIKYQWVKAWIPCTQYLTTTSDENPEIEVRFNGSKIYKDMKLLEENTRVDEIKVKFNPKMECNHNWVREPREINERTTYSCSKCDDEYGCA